MASPATAAGAERAPDRPLASGRASDGSPGGGPVLARPAPTRRRPSLVPPGGGVPSGGAPVAHRPSAVPARAAWRAAGQLAPGEEPGSSQMLAGQPLPAGVRDDMEARFRHDFSRVQVHDDPAAGEAAAARGASAFTRGGDIFFAPGRYEPRAPAGRRLLAHELAHVVQQSNVVQQPNGSGRTGSPERVTMPADPTEVEADRAASAVMGGARPDVRARIGGTAVTQRQPPPGSAPPAAPAAPPASMSIANVSGPTAGSCANVDWKVNFVLPTPSVAGGYFVQDVAINLATTDCAGAARPAQSISVRYWEAWHVNPGGTMQDLVANGTYNYTDWYSNPNEGPGTKGRFSVVGSVAFYEGLTLPPTFVPNNPATFAGHLPSTRTDPALRGGTPALAHSINGTWNCCPEATPTVIGGHTP